MVSAPPCHGGGRGFKSRRGRRPDRNGPGPGSVAQLVERSTENRKVTGSTPVGATTSPKSLGLRGFFVRLCARGGGTVHTKRGTVRMRRGPGPPLPGRRAPGGVGGGSAIRARRCAHGRGIELHATRAARLPGDYSQVGWLPPSSLKIPLLREPVGLSTFRDDDQVHGFGCPANLRSACTKAGSLSRPHLRRPSVNHNACLPTRSNWLEMARFAPWGVLNSQIRPSVSASGSFTPGSWESTWRCTSAPILFPRGSALWALRVLTGRLPRRSGRDEH